MSLTSYTRIKQAPGSPLPDGRTLVTLDESGGGGPGPGGGGATDQTIVTVHVVDTPVPVGNPPLTVATLPVATIHDARDYVSVIDLTGAHAAEDIGLPLPICFVTCYDSTEWGGEKIVIFDNRMNATECRAYFDVWFSKFTINFQTNDLQELVDALYYGYLYIPPSKQLMLRLSTKVNYTINLFVLREDPTDATAGEYGYTNTQGALVGTPEGLQLPASAFSVWAAYQQSFSIDSYSEQQAQGMVLKNLYWHAMTTYFYEGTMTLLFQRRNSQGVYADISRIVVTWDGTYIAGTTANTPNNVDMVWQDWDTYNLTWGWTTQLLAYEGVGAARRLVWTSYALEASRYLIEPDNPSMEMNLLWDPQKNNTDDCIVRVSYSPANTIGFSNQFIRISNFQSLRDEVAEQQTQVREAIMFLESYIDNAIFFDRTNDMRSIAFHKGTQLVFNLRQDIGDGSDHAVSYNVVKTSDGAGTFDDSSIYDWNANVSLPAGWEWQSDVQPPANVTPNGNLFQPFTRWSAYDSAWADTFYIRLNGIEYYCTLPYSWSTTIRDLILATPYNPPMGWRVVTDKRGFGKWAHIIHGSGKEEWNRLDSTENIFQSRFTDNTELFSIENKITFPNWVEGHDYVAGDIVNYTFKSFVCILDHTSAAGDQVPPFDLVDTKWRVDDDYFGNDGGTYITTYDEDNPPIFESVLTGSANFGSNRLLLRNGYAFVCLLDDHRLTPTELAFIDKGTKPVYIEANGQIPAGFPWVPMIGWPEKGIWQWTVFTNDNRQKWVPSNEILFYRFPKRGTPNAIAGSANFSSADGIYSNPNIYTLMTSVLTATPVGEYSPALTLPDHVPAVTTLGTLYDTSNANAIVGTCKVNEDGTIDFYITVPLVEDANIGVQA